MTIREAVPRARKPPGDRPQPSAGSDAWLRRLSLGATATTFVLIAVGGLVRATESGLGCSGWPKCTEEGWLPPLESHAIIEYTHRFIAFLVIVLVALLAVLAWRRFRSTRRVLVSASVAVLLVLFQAALGGIVVRGELHALLVSAHLATAMVFAGALVYLTVQAFTLGATRSRSSAGLRRMAWAAATGTLALIAVGAYVRGEGAGLVFPDWPLMDGRLIPIVSSAPAGVHFAHRVLAVVVGALILLVAARAVRERPAGDEVRVLALTAALLFVAQVLIGAANVWSKLAPAAVVAHVAVASLAWGAAVATAVTAGGVPAGERPQASLASVAR